MCSRAVGFSSEPAFDVSDFDLKKAFRLTQKSGHKSSQIEGLFKNYLFTKLNKIGFPGTVNSVNG